VTINNIIKLSITKFVHSIEIVPSCIKIGKEQLNVLEFADDIVLTWKNGVELRQCLQK